MALQISADRALPARLVSPCSRNRSLSQVGHVVDIDVGPLGLRSYGFDLVTTTPPLHLLSTWEPHHVGISRRSVNVQLGDANNDGSYNRAGTLEVFRHWKGGADCRRDVRIRNDNVATLNFGMLIKQSQIISS